MVIAIIGPITKDKIILANKSMAKIGGTAFYSSITLANLGIKTEVFTKLSAEDKNLFSALKHRNISISPYFCNSTTSFRNIYHGERREQFVEGIAEPFSVKEIKSVKDCKIVHLGPLTRKEIPLAILKYLKFRGLIISLDVQGYMRQIKNNKVRLTDWREKRKFLKYVDIVKADKKEASIITRKKGEAAAKSLAAMGPKEVLITDGAHGSAIYADGRYFSIPAFTPFVIKDVTGCGDTYVAAYLAKRLKSSDLKECGLFAARCATIKIERGYFSGFKS